MKMNVRTSLALLAVVMLAFASGCPSGESGKSEGGDKPSKDKKDNKKDDDKGDDDDDDGGDKGSKADLPDNLGKKDLGGATVVVPSPDTMLTALSILGDPKWDDLIKPVKKLEYDSKTQTAIVSGIVLAQFFVHVHAKDSKKADKSLDDLLEMAKSLGIKPPEKEVKAVRKRIKKKQWLPLRQDFLDMNASIQDDLIKRQKKPDLAILITLGAYIEGANLGSRIISEDYSKTRAELLRQADLLSEVERTTKASLNTDDKHVAIVLKTLKKMKKLMKTSGDDPVSKEAAEEIHEEAKKTRKKLLKA